jgi:hypothetical protein
MLILFFGNFVFGKNFVAANKRFFVKIDVKSCYKRFATASLSISKIFAQQNLKWLLRPQNQQLEMSKIFFIPNQKSLAAFLIATSRRANSYLTALLNFLRRNFWASTFNK